MSSVETNVASGVPVEISKPELIPASKETHELEHGLRLEVAEWSLASLLPEARLEMLEQRFPQLERTLKTATFRIPTDAKPIFAMHPKFDRILEEVNQGKDIAGIFKGGAAGSEIGKNPAFQNMPSRYEEYEVLRQKGIYGNFFQFQVGGWPFNLGSLFYEQRDSEVFVTTQDLVVQKAYVDSEYKPRLYGKDSPFCGMAVMDNGETQFLEVELDVTSPAFLQASAEIALDGVRTFIATQPALVKYGRPVPSREVYGSSKMSDIRHWVGLPYFDLVDAAGKSVKGSLFMEGLNRMVIEDQGETLLQAIESGSAIEVHTRTDNVSRRLAEEIKANWGDKDLQTKCGLFGITEETLEAIIDGENVHFAPTEAVYPHIFWGKFKDGDWGVSVTSGLLKGNISGQNGIPSTVIPDVLSAIGYQSAVFGSQGKDSGQVYMNGENIVLKHLYGEEYEQKYGATVEDKSATTPSIALHWTDERLVI